jgi:molybdopterin-containing oxidoreductase family membrane subunit
MSTALAPTIPELAAEEPRAAEEPSMVTGEQTLAGVTDKVCRPIEAGMPRWWKWAFLVSTSFLLLGAFTTTYLISTGVGVWGENSTVGWAFDITNFVWWVGIGHAGTLISAILLLFRQRWRNSINRFAEAMTLFAVACAGIYPMIHIGRVWMAWYFFPLPYSFGVWPQAYSPLWWDFFAISTYAIVSLLFWYIGLLPDLASLRDRATTRTRFLFYGVLSLGWRGSQRHWHHYETACLLLAGLATPLVVSVHTIVSFDFATSVIPGWHATFFPPYFVAGAIFSGFAMVLTLMIPIRRLFGLEDLITIKHLECMAKVVLTTGMIVGYAYTTEFFLAWYSGDEVERFVFTNRAFGPYAWAYWIMFSCNVLSPQILWFKAARTSPWVLFGVSIAVNIGMWFERFVIIVTSLHRDFLPSSWSYFIPTWVDVGQMLGHMGLFVTLLLLFVRYLPMINAAEVKRLLPEAPAGPSPNGEEQFVTPSSSGSPAAVLARFSGPAELLAAARQMRALGYQRLDAFGPLPVEGMREVLGSRRSPLPWFTLIGGITGLALAVAGLYYIHLIDYPLIVGGKQPGSWQGFIPIMFEMTILLGAFGTVLGLLCLCRLPRFYHPLFRHPAFSKVSDDAFLLAVEAGDPLWSLEETPALLHRLGGTDVAFVEP